MERTVTLSGGVTYLAASSGLRLALGILPASDNSTSKRFRMVLTSDCLTACVRLITGIF